MQQITNVTGQGVENVESLTGESGQKFYKVVDATGKMTILASCLDQQPQIEGVTANATSGNLSFATETDISTNVANSNTDLDKSSSTTRVTYVEYLQRI